MPRLAIAVVASLAIGLAAGAWLTFGEPLGMEVSESLSNPTDERSSLGDRVLSLERELEEERNAREVLEEQLLAVFEQLEGYGPEFNSSRSGPVGSERSETQDRSRYRQRDMVARVREFQERRIAGLIENGFSQDEAERLLKLESDAQFEVMQAMYEAQRKDERFDVFSGRVSAQSILRENIGDTEYERFLIAQGQRTNVRIASVLDGSPGGKAGLQPGDEIISYNGERTFSMMDLRNLAFGGEAGEDAIIEVDRDGVRMQLSIPRGPIGMNGSGANVGTMNWWGG
jgi:hypothetical protein